MPGAEIIAPCGAFDYGDLDEEVAGGVREAAQRIRYNSSTAIVLVGQDLLTVKELLGHGRFLPWVETEFAWSDKQAQRFMNAARWAEGRADILSNLKPTAIYLLSAPATPPEIVEAVEAKVRAGESMSPKAIQEMMDAARERAPTQRRRAELQPPPKPAPLDPKADAQAAQAAFMIFAVMKGSVPALLRMMKAAGDEGSALYRNLEALASTPAKKAAE
ncbi:DUF3102 domain-containing protein [Dongia sedimenti]|uniref:DUF3102 domain-containing protein n=1 Tax=Dongia sedimenti TaxID=3064282 RepID=A0ABU0YYC7_9PROT|nr:DUF3102 domain-containing protein [Rhodospirillaceae bacterium R-7]